MLRGLACSRHWSRVSLLLIRLLLAFVGPWPLGLRRYRKLRLCLLRWLRLRRDALPSASGRLGRSRLSLRVSAFRYIRLFQSQFDSRLEWWDCQGGKIGASPLFVGG